MLSLYHCNIHLYKAINKPPWTHTCTHSKTYKYTSSDIWLRVLEANCNLLDQLKQKRTIVHWTSMNSLTPFLSLHKAVLMLLLWRNFLRISCKALWTGNKFPHGFFFFLRLNFQNGSIFTFCDGGFFPHLLILRLSFFLFACFYFSVHKVFSLCDFA